ncbi:MAG: GyrI-like domain-containing protein [Anaerolineae bacterium]|nr:GyrI-like domain-containing protein [Anaerolineae bacterium]
MSYQCKIEEKMSQPIVSIRTRTPVQELPRVIGEAYGTLMQYLGSSGKFPVGPAFAAYYNMDMQDLDVEMGFPVAESLPGKNTIVAGEMAAGKYASCVHVGPYDSVGPAYTALTQFVQEQGYEPTGVAYEVYLNDPDETPPEKLQTQILFPLK